MAVARQLKPNEITTTPEVPELPPPRMNGHDKVEENVVSVKRSSQRPMSMGGLSLSSQREEDCYTVMSPAGPLTMLPHSTGSLGQQYSMKEQIIKLCGFPSPKFYFGLA